ncbi:hypothetical protein DPMN_107259 [Dreissena polymorpha]|uniref:OTU domain-containing protein n=1 Tax=Dreissena polymorpha TaxID=45954 RepID=A0A9D4QKR4_DREPO|nr:hypothetical protein DPMN_107256 [Dreissena polymorpha]KAH3833943.1 hypothetical protein DPMN_107259 [Dreissena polymorpha]
MNDEKQLLNQASSEAKLLSQYGVTIPRHIPDHHQIDYISITILKMYHPPMTTVYDPVQIIGDGNCLYRTLSYAISGCQDHHVLLRLFAALELIQHRHYYDTGKKYNFLNDTRILMSDYSKILFEALTLNMEILHICMR